MIVHCLRFLLVACLLGFLSGCGSNLIDEFSATIPNNVVREYSQSVAQRRYDSLLAEYGTNKELPLGYELQTLLALSHYPQLKNTKIKFIVDNVDIPLSSRPHWASMLNSASNRTYLVVIDSQRTNANDAILLKNQPFNAQTGIIGHELAHTVYYLDRSVFQIIADAVCQLSDCRVGFERATDKRLVDFGLGWQRYDHSVFVRQSRGQPINTIARSSSPYMSPVELLTLMEAHPAYKPTLAQR
jgi:hypothetical protein